jgi:hypothetical protein
LNHRCAFLKQNLMALTNCRPISASTPSAFHAAIRPVTRGATAQGTRTMTKNLALAASMAMLMTISGQAFAKTAVPSDQQAAYAFNAFDRVAATEAAAPDAHRYHGGPKYND